MSLVGVPVAYYPLGGGPLTGSPSYPGQVRSGSGPVVVAYLDPGAAVPVKSAAGVPYVPFGGTPPASGAYCVASVPTS